MQYRNRIIPRLSITENIFSKIFIMPFSSDVTGPPLPHLSQIIKLEPEKEPWCAGYAPSQGRRCHTRTNSRGRSTATYLLNQSTKELHAGRCIDNLLEDLAPHVLCTRFHQHQSSELATRWQRQVRSFLSSRSRPTPPRRLARQPSVNVYPEVLGGSATEQWFILYQRVYAVEELRRIQTVHEAPTVVLNPPLQTSALPTRGDNNATINRDTNNNNSSSASTRSSTEQVRPRRAIIQPATRLEATNTATFIHVSNSRLATTSTIHSRSNNAPRQTDPGATLQTTASVSRPTLPTRRSVEGDCGICLFPLQEPHSDSIDDKSDAEDETDDEYENDEYEEEGESYSDKEEDEEEGKEEEAEELLWCKAQCGVNFHKNCINQWLEESPYLTCPACRRTWRS